jgi:drug/metabolite transporter (DMT)-like permease
LGKCGQGQRLSIWILLAVLGAAFLHALWNALIKVGTSRIGAMVVLSVAEVPIGLAIALPRPAMNAEAWPWVIAAGCTHFFYKSFLVFAYDRGDLSRVYPLARGAAPLAVALIGAAFLADNVSGPQYAGIALLACGIALMARGVFTDGESRHLIPFALGSAAATATYTLLDGLGARVSGDAIAYVAWVFVADGLIFTIGSLMWRGWGVVPMQPKVWVVGSFASLASYGAYAISIWAMTVAPIAVVAALRETSILFAVLIGWLVFGERMTRDKAIASGLIVVGIIVTRL